MRDPCRLGPGTIRRARPYHSVGTLPIALGFGAGAEARRPLGLAVEGGLVVSQLLTLYLTPVFYIYMEKFRELGKGMRRREAVPRGELRVAEPLHQ